ncbi:MAG TPA: DUF881 domain-containing protein, partial [Armatimonadota bacterium]|nr:DUF881 domain-containing protein [Armatimonadota bacterium]
MRRFLLCTWVALSVPAAAGVYSAGAALALAPSRAEAADDLEARLARAERLAGLTSIQGPGLVVVLRHSPIRAPRGVDRRTLMIHDQDLNAVLNALRVAGAEALAVGGRDAAVPERVLVSTAARDDRNGVTVNGVSLQPPYRVTAVGDPRALRAELFRESGVVRKAGLDTLQMIDVQEAQDLVVPAARGGSDSAAASVPRTSPGTEYRAPREERVERPTTPRVPAGRVGQPGTVAAVVRRNQSGGTYIAPPPGPRTVHEEDIQPYRAAQPDPRVATALPRPPGPPTIHEAERPSSRRV